MAVIYEHWRPDINECFYVGASRAAEDSRPYYYGHHNSDYDAVVSQLNENNMVPFTKIVWENLEDDCVGTYEKLRIANWKGLIGERLTNVANGGFGFDIDWTEDQRKKHSEILKISHNTEEFLAKRSLLSKNLWENEVFRVATITAQNEGKARFRETPEYQAYVETQREISLDIWSDEERIEAQRIRITAAWSNEQLIEEQSIRTTTSWKDPEIRAHRVEGLNRPDIIEANTAMVTALWKTEDYRGKMMRHAWWLSNVRDRKYWGA